MSKKNIINKNTADIPAVQEHYQDYPYPYRNPEDEKKRLLHMVGESLGELNHFLFKGKENFDSGFRCLIAGGGTGDSAIYLAEQLKNNNAEIVYLDFSKPSMEVAKKRAEARGLTNIKWVYDSILNIPSINLGKFDYINCSGVLHHLPSPPKGLSILKDSLNDNGGMHLMVYAKYGRTAVYQIQEIMKMVNQGATSRIEEVMNGKIVLNSLPTTSWHNHFPINDYALFGDVGLYDMYLHKQDRCYSIPELYQFVGNSGLNFVEFTDVSERLALKIENYIKDFTLLQKLKRMDIVTQQAICEIMVGNIYKHSFYVSNQKDSVADLNDLNNVPYFYGIAGAAQQIFDHINAGLSTIGGNVSYTFNSGLLKGVSLCIPITQYTKYMFEQVIAPGKSMLEIFDSVREEMQQDVSNSHLLQEAYNVFSPFFDTGTMLLCDKSL